MPPTVSSKFMVNSLAFRSPQVLEERDGASKFDERIGGEGRRQRLHLRTAGEEEKEAVKDGEIH